MDPKKTIFEEAATRKWAGKKLKLSEEFEEIESFNPDREDIPDIYIDKDDRYEDH